jgi:membrane dipeptidase
MLIRLLFWEYHIYTWGNFMKIIDTHCDMLSRMLADRTVRFTVESTGTDVSLPRLQKAGIAVQVFALYLSESLTNPGMDELLDMIDIYRERVLPYGKIVPIRTPADVDRVWSSGEIGGLLSLEGVDGLKGNFVHLRTLFALGVRFLGITWNHANWAADGVVEPRKGGFTNAGRRLMAECERLGIVLDVSHLSDSGFWELVELSRRPFVASHSNARKLCPHPRNLTDEQITAIVQRNGRISLTFVPWFLREKEAAISDLLRHIEHFCSLGAVHHIGFGSDFDGFQGKIPGLSHPGDYPALVELLLKHFRQEEVEGFMAGNWRSFLRTILPQEPVR